MFDRPSNATHRFFYELLKMAQEERKKRGIDGEDGWPAFERRTMFEAVNQHRVKKGLPLLEIKSVTRVEGWAAGHVDYTIKFALYCAELAEGRSNMQP